MDSSELTAGVNEENVYAGEDGYDADRDAVNGVAVGLDGAAGDGFDGVDDSYDDEDGESDGGEESAPPINPDIKWYVIHTYSGYENKVKANIEKVIDNRGMQEVILDIVVPMEEQIEIKDGRKKVTLRKVFPGYVLIKMLMTDETWYVVRNTRGVTGFVGPGSRPVPLSEEEVKAMGVEEFLPVVDYEIGDNVRVADGPLESFIGIVEDINMEKKKVRVLVSMFGRETPVELELVQIQKL
jgi:transcriptional antiterminator NusG